MGPNPAFWTKRLTVSPSKVRSQAANVSGGLSYKDSGVDIDAGAELVRRIQKLSPSIGGFSGLVPFGTLLHARKGSKS